MKMRVRSPLSIGKHRGSVSLELLLILPVFVIVLLGLVELTQIVVVEQKLALAGFSGANTARHGGSNVAPSSSNPSDIAAAVDAVLGDGALREHRIIKVFRVKMTANGPEEEEITAPGDVQDEPPLTLIKVEVCVPADKVVPNYLGIVGFSLKNTQLCGYTVLPKE